MARIRWCTCRVENILTLGKLLKGNCSGKKIVVFIPSIDRVCCSDAQEKKLDFLHGSVRRYKPLTSTTNCGCGHLMTHFVGIAISVVAFT